MEWITFFLISFSKDVSGGDLLSSFEMSEEELDPVLQVPLAMAAMTSTAAVSPWFPPYSIPPKVLYALDPKRRLEDDLHLKLIAEEQGRDPTLMTCKIYFY